MRTECSTRQGQILLSLIRYLFFAEISKCKCNAAELKEREAGLLVNGREKVCATGNEAGWAPDAEEFDNSTLGTHHRYHTIALCDTAVAESFRRKLPHARACPSTPHSASERQ